MRRKLKNSLIFFLCWLMAFSSALPLCAFSQEPEGEIWENGLCYLENAEPKASLEELEESESVSRKLNSKTYYTEGTQLNNSVKAHLEKREESFDVYYITRSILRLSNVGNVVYNTYECAWDDSASVNSYDGDYLHWGVTSYGYSSYNYDGYQNGYYFYTIKYICNYYSTADEEAQVDEVVDTFVSSIDTNALTDYEIIKEIHDYICSAATYDDDAANNIGNINNACSAYGALIKGKAVCQGYAVAFYRLCKELGYNCRFVSSDPDPKKGCHAWNIVELDGKYYYVDTTWDDSYLEGDRIGSPYTYFLVNYENLQKYDSKKKEHLLYDVLYDNKYFLENYGDFIDENNYNPNNKNLISQCRISLSGSSFVYTGNEIKPELTITTDGNVEGFPVSYTDNINTGIASLNVLSGDNTRVISHRNFVIVPKKMTALSLGGRETNAIRLNWNSADCGISGYKLEVKKDGKWQEKSLSAAAVTCKISSLSPATQYTFRIRSYKKVGKKNYYGAYCTVYNTATSPKTPAATISTASKSVTLKWKSIACSGYEVRYSQSSSMSNSSTVYLSSAATTKKISGLKKGKRYYVQVRAYKTFKSTSGKQYKCYSSWSAKKSIVCK